MAAGQSSKANQRQGKSHKAGYNKYRAEMRREKNKLRRLRKHLVKHAHDHVAYTAKDVVTKSLKGYV
jgi:hypothetical protein